MDYGQKTPNAEFRISKEQKLWSMDHGLSTNPIYPQLPCQEFAERFRRCGSRGL